MVATPIGNLADISLRAVQVLKEVALILAEDTRHSRPLLNHYGITTRLKACHEHNESSLVEWVVNALAQGQDIALISDAGTPLISDPGFVLVRELRNRGAEIQTVPGPSSIIAALSIAGLPTDRFVYEGFLPAKSKARQTVLQRFIREDRTVVLLESSHRIVASLEDICAVMGAQRPLSIARELTKKFETVLSGSAGKVLETVKTDPDQQRGEFVVLIGGVDAAEQQAALVLNLEQTLRVLLPEMPLKQAAGLAAKLTGNSKNKAYELALSIRDD